MKHRLTCLTVLIGCTVATGNHCFAEKNAKLKPGIVTPGKVLLEESFAGKALGKQWTVNKGRWSVSEGVVTGQELPADKHAAVLTCRVPNHNSTIRLSFQLGKAKAFHVSYNKKRGHLFRVVVDAKGAILKTDKPSKKSKTPPVVLARAKTPFQTDQWYTMQIDVQGERVSVQFDNGITLKGSHSSLDVAKPSYRFILRGEGLQLDDITINAAKP